MDNQYDDDHDHDKLGKHAVLIDEHLYHNAGIVPSYLVFAEDSA